jgi:hypothetical protein
MGGTANFLIGLIFGVIAAVVIFFSLKMGYRSSFGEKMVIIKSDRVIVGSESMDLDMIEDVEISETGGEVRLVGNGKILGLSAYFCPIEQREYLRHELSRLIIEVGVR